MTASRGEIRVWVVRGTGSAARLQGDTAVPIAEILAYGPIDPPRPGKPRDECVWVKLRELPVELESWVFRYDDDQPPQPREIYIWESVQQVRGMIALAEKEGRTIATEDLGNAVADELRRVMGVHVTPMKRLDVNKKRPPD